MKTSSDQSQYPDVSVVLPVLNAEPWLNELLNAITSQRDLLPAEIILIDSGSTDNTLAIASRHKSVRVLSINNFSHGRVRNMGAREAKGNIIVFISQDALPADKTWLRNLVEPFSDGKVAAVYSRQQARTNASPMEKFFLNHHFPPGTHEVRMSTDNRELRFQDVFFSNVSGAVRRDLMLKHPFDESLIMSEDQQLSRDLLKAGYAVVYQPTSLVIHSHDYSLATVFQRFFDSVYSLQIIFPSQSFGTTLSLAVPYLVRESWFMLTRYPAWLPYYVLYVGARGLAVICSHFAENMPRKLARKLSFHKYYWDRK